MRRFSSGDTRSTSRTCVADVLPKSVQTGAFVARRAATWASSSGPTSARQVEPKAATFAETHGTSLARSNTSPSLGFEPGHPSSTNATPSPSRSRAMRSLSAADRLIPSRCVPSRSVVS